MQTIILKAFAGGLPLVLVSAVLGSMIQWRRMAFFGDTISHSALLGIGLSLLLGVSYPIGIIVVTIFIALFLHSSGNSKIPMDTALAVCAHLSLAGGILTLYLAGSKVHWETILFGNILALTTFEVMAMITLAFIVTLVCWRLWPTLVMIAVNDEIAKVEIRHKDLVNLVFLLLLCAYVTIGVRMVGVLLLNALLIIPAAAVRPLSTSPGLMVVLATILGMISITGGIAITFTWDVPAAPACVLLAGVAFVGTWLWQLIRKYYG